MYQPMQWATYLWASVGNDRHTGITTAWPLFPLLPPYFPPLSPLRQTSLNLLCSEAATNQYRNADRMLGLGGRSSFHWY